MTEDELLELIGLARGELARWVEHGWVQPGRRAGRSRYRDVDVARVRLIRELRYDLGVNEDGISVTLSLMDQVYGLRRDLRRLTDALANQPDDVKQRIAREIGVDGSS
ncbi:MAG: MerR family transcriptional regulator [Proteobacteria bacterium]|nr:MerR family transcriptional regulator [Pseudomonadota bacterium]